MPRTINDGESPLQILQALAAVMISNTNLASSIVLINTIAPLYLATQGWPALALEEGTQSSARIAYRLWQTKLTVIATYYQSWLGSGVVNDTLWAGVDTDLRRMKANIEDNPTLTVASVRACEGVIHVALTPYQGQALSKTDSPFPVPVILRQATISVNCLPYTSAL